MGTPKKQPQNSIRELKLLLVCQDQPVFGVKAELLMLESSGETDITPTGNQLIIETGFEGEALLQIRHAKTATKRIRIINSADLPASSYQCGVVKIELHPILDHEEYSPSTDTLDWQQNTAINYNWVDHEGNRHCEYIPTGIVPLDAE